MTGRWRFISDHHMEYGIQRLCRIFGVSRSGRLNPAGLRPHQRAQQRFSYRHAPRRVHPQPEEVRHRNDSISREHLHPWRPVFAAHTHRQTLSLEVNEAKGTSLLFRAAHDSTVFRPGLQAGRRRPLLGRVAYLIPAGDRDGTPTPALNPRARYRGRGA